MLAAIAALKLKLRSSKREFGAVSILRPLEFSERGAHVFKLKLIV